MVERRAEQIGRSVRDAVEDPPKSLWDFVRDTLAAVGIPFLTLHRSHSSDSKKRGFFGNLLHDIVAFIRHLLELLMVSWIVKHIVHWVNKHILHPFSHHLLRLPHLPHIGLPHIGFPHIGLPHFWFPHFGFPHLLHWPGDLLKFVFGWDIGKDIAHALLPGHNDHKSDGIPDGLCHRAREGLRTLRDGVSAPLLHRESAKEGAETKGVEAGVNTEWEKEPHFWTLYPLHGFFFLLQNRHLILYPAFGKVLASVVASLIVTAVVFVTFPVTLTGIHFVLPWILAVIPSFAWTLLLVLVAMKWIMAKAHTQAERQLLKTFPAKVAWATRRVHIHWLLDFPLSFVLSLIPFIGIPLVIYVRGLQKAHLMARAAFLARHARPTRTRTPRTALRDHETSDLRTTTGAAAPATPRLVAALERAATPKRSARPATPLRVSAHALGPGVSPVRFAPKIVEEVLEHTHTNAGRDRTPRDGSAGGLASRVVRCRAVTPVQRLCRHAPCDFTPRPLHPHISAHNAVRAVEAGAEDFAGVYESRLRDFRDRKDAWEQKKHIWDHGHNHSHGHIPGIDSILAPTPRTPHFEFPKHRLSVHHKPVLRRSRLLDILRLQIATTALAALELIPGVGIFVAWVEVVTRALFVHNQL